MTDQEATTATVTVLIEELADKYAKELDKQIKARMTEMEQDDRSYYLIYQVLRSTERCHTECCVGMCPIVKRLFLTRYAHRISSPLGML